MQQQQAQAESLLAALPVLAWWTAAMAEDIADQQGPQREQRQQQEEK